MTRNQELLETEAEDRLNKELVAKEEDTNSAAKWSTKLLEMNLKSKHMLILRVSICSNEENC